MITQKLKNWFNGLLGNTPENDTVELSSMDSFPASDAPGWIKQSISVNKSTEVEENTTWIDKRAA